VSLLGRHPRATPFLSLSKEDLVVIDAVENDLLRFAKGVRRKAQLFPVDEFSFYSRAKVSLIVYKGKSMWFDLIVLLCVVVYLWGVYAALNGLPAAVELIATIADRYLLSFFRGGKKRSRNV